MLTYLIRKYSEHTCTLNKFVKEQKFFVEGIHHKNDLVENSTALRGSSKSLDELLIDPRSLITFFHSLN